MAKKVLKLSMSDDTEVYSEPFNMPPEHLYQTQITCAGSGTFYFVYSVLSNEVPIKTGLNASITFQELLSFLNGKALKVSGKFYLVNMSKEYDAIYASCNGKNITVKGLLCGTTGWSENTYIQEIKGSQVDIVVTQIY